MKNINEIYIWGIKINPYSISEFVDVIEDNIISRNELIQQTGINAYTIVSIKSDPVLYEAVSKSTLINIDGMAVAWALRFLGFKKIAKASCPDIFDKLIEKAAEKKYRPFFLGATPAVINMAVQNLKLKYPKLEIAGYHHGFFSDTESENLAETIRSSNADMLFLGMPSPKKELFSEKYIQKMQIPFTFGVGGVFDILANKTKRAPVWMQNAGLEWFHRFTQEPSRMWKRYLLGNTKFILYVLKEKFKRKSQKHENK
jgi:N-acetylglucosaminyldiphosphoundecaprenol N-acetyl-beta-D-mannosaminyltransferase